MLALDPEEAIAEGHEEIPLVIYPRLQQMRKTPDDFHDGVNAVENI